VAFTTLAASSLAYTNKTFIVSNIDLLYQHPRFVEGLALFILFLEFRWQRVLLTSKLSIPNRKIESLRQQLIHPSFWILNIKTILYFAIFIICSKTHIGMTLWVYFVWFPFCSYRTTCILLSAHPERFSAPSFCSTIFA